MRRVPLLAAMLLAATPAAADPLTVTKSVTVISDPLGSVVPRSLPGAVVEYKSRATNPAANVLVPVKDLLLVENLPVNVELRVADLATAGKGPVEFADGSLLGTGLLPSGLSYNYSTAAPTTDGLEFSTNGTNWTYQPVANAAGYDPAVRAIRIKLTGNFTAATSFQLRYRARIR
ncbi:hypothetical protein SAMN06297144_0561 [Sphingomonas guangdongensis]|uniref:YD repeat-containing protein n=1 Tax=Sphingomonas guangdongensis TaxID=1141890 RepID=A0A285QBZ8_9SPHN|nr:hypothetical protein [Sphingomonas guangdongensis]SOB79460.1 hypothetical protein SAMN06297144_0561 [Sphingomonas guangdongensis]